MRRSYAWVVTRDYSPQPDARPGSPENAAGLSGPEGITLTPEEIEQDKKDTRVALDTLFKIIRVWTNVIQQEIPVRHPRPSAYDKVMHKEGRPPADVQVTHLRRYEQRPPTGLVEVDWAYRWKVKGHHRWQRVGPGRAFLRQVWVKEHIKGPADKPLVERDKLTSLDR